MEEKKEYKCVNCGMPASALYKNYGPSVLKLTKCGTCKGIVDKYVEYDPVIVMIDLVLMSREAQRHIIYNTEFKAYWKLFIILTLLETFVVWRNGSLFNIAINTLCDIKNNNTDVITMYTMNMRLPETWNRECEGWIPGDKDGSDLFIWEKDFYVQFLATFAGIVMYICTVHILMMFFCNLNKGFAAPLQRVLKSFSLANVSVLLCVPMLVWGPGAAAPHTLLYHCVLVHAYRCVLLYNVLAVLYEGPRSLTAAVLVLGHCVKYLTTFHATSFIRNIIKFR